MMIKGGRELSAALGFVVIWLSDRCCEKHPILALAKNRRNDSEP
jgi:hypothetical protein